MVAATRPSRFKSPETVTLLVPLRFDKRVASGGFVLTLEQDSQAMLNQFQLQSVCFSQNFAVQFRGVMGINRSSSVGPKTVGALWRGCCGGLEEHPSVRHFVVVSCYAAGFSSSLTVSINALAFDFERTEVAPASSAALSSSEFLKAVNIKMLMFGITSLSLLQ